MDDMRLQYQAQQYWFDGSDREAYFIGKAVAHATAINKPTSAEEIRAALWAGKMVRTGQDWDACIRSLAALDAQRAAAPPPPPVTMIRCDCGHTIQAAAVMNASLGSTCPDCYDRLSY